MHAVAALNRTRQKYQRAEDQTCLTDVRVDASLNVLRKESDGLPGAGWSQVAAKGAPVRHVERPMPLGSKGGFAVLSLSSAKKKKEKEKQVEVADDWEAAEEVEEEKERSAADSAAGSLAASEDEGDGEIDCADKAAATVAPCIRMLKQCVQTCIMSCQDMSLGLCFKT